MVDAKLQRACLRVEAAGVMQHATTGDDVTAQTQVNMHQNVFTASILKGFG